MVWVFRNSETTLGARLVLLVLAEYGHDDGRWCFPEVATIARKARMSRKGVQEALRRLERDGHIEQTGTRPSGTRVYRIVGIEEHGGGEVTSPPGEDDDLAGAKMTDSRGEVTSPDPQGPQTEDPHKTLSASWLENAPPLIPHRAPYFSESKAKTAADKALRVYPVEAVTAAISNYATVLGGADYRWSHRWTFVDFLNRGLDKFVPEADPLGNFRDRQGGRRPARTEAEQQMLDDIPDL